MKQTESLRDIFIEVFERAKLGDKDDFYSSNYNSYYFKDLEKLLKGLYLTVNNVDTISSEENSTIEINVYTKSLILALMCNREQTEEEKINSIDYKSFLSKLRTRKINKITDKEKIEFLKRICKELLNQNPPDDIKNNDWEESIQKFYIHQIENIKISAKERDIKNKYNEIISHFLKRFYKYNNGGSVVAPSNFVDNLFIENGIEKYLSVNIGNGNPWVELLDLDEREYLLTTLEERIVNLMKQWEQDVANALYEKQKDCNICINDLIKKTQGRA